MAHGFGGIDLDRLMHRTHRPRVVRNRLDHGAVDAMGGQRAGCHPPALLQIEQRHDHIVPDLKSVAMGKRMRPVQPVTMALKKGAIGRPVKQAPFAAIEADIEMMPRDIAAGIGQNPIHPRAASDLDPRFRDQDADRPAIVQYMKVFNLQRQGHVTSIGAEKRLGHIEETGKVE